MAAGKMYLAAKARKPRRASNFKKAVQAIAKKTVLRQSETKTASYSTAQALGTNGLLLPVWKQIVQGDAQQNRDGDRIRAMGIRIRGALSVTATTNQDGCLMRMIVFSGKRPISTITDAGLSWNSTVDPELLTVLSDSIVTFKIDGRTRIVNKYVKFNRLVQYNPTGTDPSKNELYVCLLPTATLGATGSSATAGWYCDWIIQPYYKDL